MTRRATMADIAARAGVSRYTVSRILRGETQGKWAVTAQRAAEIQTIAAELGYRPHTGAQATASGRFGATALLTRADGNDFLPANLIRVLVTQLGMHDLHLSVECLGSQNLEDREHLPKLLRARSVDGFFISSGNTLPRGLRRWLEDGGLPAVWLNRKHRHQCVHPDDRAAARRLVDLHVERGHSRIAYLPPSASPPRFRFTADQRELIGWQEDAGRCAHYSEKERAAGYRAGCTAAGIEACLWDSIAADPDAAVADLIARLHSQRPSAVICYREREATLVRIAAERSGRPVPHALSVSTFTWGSFTAPALGLSTMDVNLHGYAKAAVELMRRTIAAPAQQHASIRVPFQWTDAGSVAAAPGG